MMSVKDEMSAFKEITGLSWGIMCEGDWTSLESSITFLSCWHWYSVAKLPRPLFEKMWPKLAAVRISSSLESSKSAAYRAVILIICM